MGFTTAGLTNNGSTAHYKMEYDDSFSLADGRNRTNALLAQCEQDFTLMSSWFAGVEFRVGTPLRVQIVNTFGGASWSGSNIKLKPGSGTSVNLLRYLLVSEVTEMFMMSQDRGWYESHDEGSKGEGLSRFLGVQFQIANGLGAVAPAGFGVGRTWLNSPRNNFVDVNPDDNQPDPVVGCTTLFIYYLHDQLRFSISNIIAAGGRTLADVYKNLTARTDGWASFIGLINSHYPQGRSYHPAGDNVFPVSELSAFSSPGQVPCGYSRTARIFVDRPAMAEVNARLSSDDPNLVEIPAEVTIPVGSMSADITIKAKAIPIPFPPKSVNVHATYAGKTLSTTVEVVPPRILRITLSPDTVVCGNSSMATVTLDVPSLLGPVVVDLISGAPGFANVPGQLTIPQNQSSGTFLITTPDIEIPFSTAHAVIYASYAGSSRPATLTVEPKVIAGILHSLTLSPSRVTGGSISHGTVSLERAVPMDTLVGLAALEPGSHVPVPGDESSIASTPASVTIHAGQVSAAFQITTQHLPPSSVRTATILAGAVVTKTAVLTVTS